eukprot:CAMPEP_0176298974 /NCGR_PEP_ID=MMETSP0121_2-20121125/59541_1 /TAXON_ID=160619 /ORGANISM="Kryptoperidinium foliaceum, Strain CCMP 1326" /LENGTH=44 /DNA_ID= /DNA_START= /DNA_END= /DNA_ORIENTATION=
MGTVTGTMLNTAAATEQTTGTTAIATKPVDMVAPTALDVDVCKR